MRALRFVDNVYDYMHAADVLVTKPGGLSIAEALVAGVPLVLCKPLPGQEERNARVLVRSRSGVARSTLERLAGCSGRGYCDRRSCAKECIRRREDWLGPTPQREAAHR